MSIVVASPNIFRRELTSYVLAEAGHPIVEVTELQALLDLVSGAAPRAIVLDDHLGAEPALTLAAVRRQTAAPILWLADPAVAQGLLEGDGRLSVALAWPYHPAELRARLDELLERADAGRAAGRARIVGSAK